MADLSNTYGAADIGVLTSLWMNVIELKPDDGIFIGAGIAHAYLNGDLIECMTNSNNVVRAGLTAKYQDTETLLSMLDYQMKKQAFLRSDKECFGAPAEEFQLSILEERAQKSLSRENELAIALCFKGGAKISSEGTVLNLAQGESAFIPASAKGTRLEVDVNSRLIIAEVP